MPYAIENALFEWEEGERRMSGAQPAERAAIERAVRVVLAELRRRLGSKFTLEELTALYGGGVDWAAELAHREIPRGDGAWVVEAAFARYARQAVDFSGGRRRLA